MSFLKPGNRVIIYPLGGNYLRQRFSVTLFKEVDPMKTFLISLFVVLLCGALIFISTTALFSQTGRGMKISVRTSAGEHIELYNASYALVIGNGNYTNGWDPLPGALQDVKEVAETLKTHGFNVTLKTELTSDEFNEAFLTFVLEHGADENNRLLFYYAGHGYTLPLANEQERGYLVMVDAPEPDTDKLGFVRGSINMETLVGESKAIRARHVLFLFDSCFSGTILNARDRVRPESISDNIRHPVRQFITAGRAHEPVPDRSVFKTAFLDLIEGRATEPFRDGYITGAELGLYLKNQVPIYNEAQHPQYGKIRDPKLDKGDFVFVLPQRNLDELPTLATVHITSTPWGATVYLDGSALGQTPLRDYEIDTGIRREKQVNIGLELTGYKSRVKNVTLTGGQNLRWDVPLEPALAPKQENVVFKLTDGELIAKSDIDSLRDEECGEVTLLRDGNKAIEVTTCREYDAALQRGYDFDYDDHDALQSGYAPSNFARNAALSFIHRCGLLDSLQEATIPPQSFISNPRVGVADLELLPLSAFPYMGETDDNVNEELTYQTAVDTASHMVTHVSQDSLTVEENRDLNDGYGFVQSLSEVVRADFNGDGIEDILLFESGFWLNPVEGSMPYGGIIVLTRESRDGKFEVIFQKYR